MNKAIGYSDTIPLIKEVNFPSGKIVLHLMDGRTISLPIEKFPEIEKLTTAQKRRYKTLTGMGLMFDDCDTVFHVSDFLGKFFSVDTIPVLKKPVKNYAATSARQLAEPKVKYKKV
ncbi:MAG: DUF2442 domain-containing protein [Bacteroidia bacterium]